MEHFFQSFPQVAQQKNKQFTHIVRIFPKLFSCCIYISIACCFAIAYTSILANNGYVEETKTFLSLPDEGRQKKISPRVMIAKWCRVASQVTFSVSLASSRQLRKFRQRKMSVIIWIIIIHKGKTFLTTHGKEKNRS